MRKSKTSHATATTPADVFTRLVSGAQGRDPDVELARLVEECRRKPFIDDLVAKAKALLAVQNELGKAVSVKKPEQR